MYISPWLWFRRFRYSFVRASSRVQRESARRRVLLRLLTTVGSGGMPRLVSCPGQSFYSLAPDIFGRVDVVLGDFADSRGRCWSGHSMHDKTIIARRTNVRQRDVQARFTALSEARLSAPAAVLPRIPPQEGPGASLDLASGRRNTMDDQSIGIHSYGMHSQWIGMQCRGRPVGAKDK